MEHNIFNLKEYLIQKKSSILTSWFHLLLEVYPKEARRHLQNQKNQFSNPVGSNYYQGLETIYGELIEDMDNDRLYQALDKILRIKAVQNLSPSQAISFIFSLKKVVRESLIKDFKNDKIPFMELLQLENRIDDLALLAFSIYIDCRETIYKLRIHEIKTKCELLERVNK
ncbi:MAG: hypothetical protein PWQ67_76 [Clostridia bacterium]|jgi:hypothetical protein|nr:hypothetical protein [Clostridia bacterium]MDN5321622.1 hypothetical protein [Clostridia bacterium]